MIGKSCGKGNAIHRIINLLTTIRNIHQRYTTKNIRYFGAQIRRKLHVPLHFSRYSAEGVTFLQNFTLKICENSLELQTTKCKNLNTISSY